MNKWIKRAFVFGVPSAMLIKGMLSTGSMLDVVLILVGIVWLALAIIIKFEGTTGGMGPDTRADISYKNSQAETRGGFFSGKTYGDDQ